MKKVIFFLCLAFILLFLTSCYSPEFSCKRCEYFDFDEYECVESLCCSDNDCNERERCINPSTEYSVCIGEDDCSENEKNEECSENKPLYCREGQTFELCSVCGCKKGFNCVGENCIKIIYPVIMVHGFDSSGQAWTTFKNWLHRDNFTAFAPDFVPSDGDINLLSAELDQEINNMLNITNSSFVSLIAHSMGGIIVRNYLNKIENAPVDKVIFIGTPHEGSSLSWYFGGDSTAAQQLRYGSDFIKELNSPPLREEISYLNIIGNKFKSYDVEYDSLILTSEAYLENQTNYYFKEDHFELIKSENVYDDIKKFLLS